MLFISMHDTPATPPGSRRRAWTPPPCARPVWSPCVLIRSPQSERVPRLAAASGLQRQYPTSFLSSPSGAAQRLCPAEEVATPSKSVDPGSAHEMESLDESSELSSLDSPGVGRVGPALPSTSIVDDILDIPGAAQSVPPRRTPLSVNTILHDWAASRFERQLPPKSQTPSPTKPANSDAHDENVFADSGKTANHDRTTALCSLAGRLRAGTQGAMRVPGYVPGDGRPVARAAPEHRTGLSPSCPSPRKLQRPVRYANSIPARRVWDSPDATQKRKRSEQQEEPDPIDQARERLRRRTSLRVAERQQRTTLATPTAPTARPPATPARPTAPTAHAAPTALAALATPTASAPPLTHVAPPGANRIAARGQRVRTETPHVSRLHQPPQTPLLRGQTPIPPRLQLSDHEVASLTARNTKKNQGYGVQIETRVERMRGTRPLSPEPHFCGGHGVVSRKGRQGSATHHARGAGDEHEYSSPPRIVQCVRWNKALVTSPQKHEPKRMGVPQSCMRQRPSRGHVPARRDDGVVVVHMRVYDDDPGA